MEALHVCPATYPRPPAWAPLASTKGERRAHFRDRRAEAAPELLPSCELRPRAYGKDRSAEQLGECHTGRLARVASAGPHHAEEPCLRSRRGSGTIFSGCSLGGVFCQNWGLSHGRPGPEIDAPGLAAVMLDLQARGCHNINLVTPAHIVPQILAAARSAAARRRDLEALLRMPEDELPLEPQGPRIYSLRFARPASRCAGSPPWWTLPRAAWAAISPPALMGST